MYANATPRLPEKKSGTTPMQTYLQMLRESLPQHEFCTVGTTAAPLPQVRPRVWILGAAKDAGLTPETWAKAVSQLENRSHQQHHHIHTCYEAVTDPRAGQASNMDWKQEAAYAECFAKALEKCVAHKKLDKSDPVPRRDARLSASFKFDTPWQAANADVLALIMKKKASSGTDADAAEGIADLSQSAFMARVSHSGVWGTLTTSSALFDFGRRMHVPARAHMKMNGWDDVDVKRLSDAEVREGMGNGMALPSLCRILFPLLQHLKYFR